MGSSTGNAFERLRKEAKRLLKAVQSGDEAALRRFTQYWPASGPSGEVRNLVRTQLVIARERGYRSWAHLKTSLLGNEERVMDTVLYTGSCSGKNGKFECTDLKWRVRHRQNNIDENTGREWIDERITINLIDTKYKRPGASIPCGCSVMIAHLSIEEAEQLQGQLAKAIAERGRADAEAKGNGSEQSS
jgi:hypothetical protein